MSEAPSEGERGYPTYDCGDDLSCLEENSPAVEKLALLKYWFSGLTMSMFTLFGVLTLEGFPDLGRAFPVISVFWTLFLLFFIVFANITLLSMVTGMVIENVLGISKSDILQQRKMEHNKWIQEMKNLSRIFKAADLDGSGSLTKDEFRRSLRTRLNNIE